MKCIVYNLEDPESKEFYVSHNGMVVRGKIGEEIDLKNEYVDVLKDAVIETQIRDIETNSIKSVRKERYKVVPMGVPDKPKEKEKPDAKEGNAKKEK